MKSGNSTQTLSELEKLKRQRQKARYAGYFAVLLIVIVLTDILDNLATNVGANITSSFITEFFVNGRVFGKSFEYEEGLALHNTISLIGYVIALLAPFYKSLADRIGRKPLFAMSALGMAVGMLIIFPLCAGGGAQGKAGHGVQPAEGHRRPVGGGDPRHAAGPDGK